MAAGCWRNIAWTSIGTLMPSESDPATGNPQEIVVGISAQTVHTGLYDY
mgnify:CR=1 FL=1